ncbi:MAG: SLBB domain-containing protein [Chitinophagaceae bacterium]|nr:SLBB domain-containing protein [Chitinophagaceae bacterium]
MGKKLLIWFIGSFLALGALQAQDILRGRDLKQVRVDELSDGDIAKIKAQLSAAGMSLEQAEPLVLSKGMSVTEFNKLKQRLMGAVSPGSKTGGKAAGNMPVSIERQYNGTDSLDTEKYNARAAKPLINPLIFGAELYTSLAPSFEPNMKMATPLNYTLGPDDVIQVSVFGIQEYSGELPVSPEGAISVPNVGQIKVAGMTIEAATQKIRSTLAGSVYRTIQSGGSKLSVSLTKIRSIKVTVIGSNRPANYNLSSLSTVFNALYVAGGPNAYGSFREIELVRNNKVERKIDLYKLLLYGDQTDNISLRDNDVIRIPAYKRRLEIQGQVKRPGIFELLPGESFQDVLQFASGFTDTAYRSSVKVFQYSDKERKVLDLKAEEFKTYQPGSGDLVVVNRVLNRFQNRVKIAGAVYRPDTYQLTAQLRVADLIRKAEGLTEDAFTGRGQIIRLEEDLSKGIRSFDVKKALAGDAEHNWLLQREDEVYISSVQELRDSFQVSIQGEVRLPGKFDFASGLSLKDLIVQAGGLTDAAYKSVEIARLVQRDSLTATDTRASEVIRADINGDLSSAAANIPLRPFDVVTVRRKAGYQIPESVIVSGQVQYPGPYALNDRSERVSSILLRAGGYTADAYPEGAYLKRYKTDAERIKAREAAKALEKNIADTSVSVRKLEQDLQREYDKIPLDIPIILRSPGSIEDLVLRAGDELYLPKFDGQVKISGAVLMATQVPYREGNSMKDYLNEAGGFSARAWRRKAYVVYANGKAATTSHFLFFKSFPKVMPGSEVVVPSKPEVKKTSTAEVIGISSAIASLAGVVIALLRL